MVGSQVRFDIRGDGLGRYNIYNYQKTVTPVSTSTSWPPAVFFNSSSLSSYKRSSNSTTSSSKHSNPHVTYAYAKVGVWFDDGLTLNKSDILFNERSINAPESVCSRACSMGEIKVVQQGDHCCWICNPCRDQEYVLDEFNCKKCLDGWWPDSLKTGCHKLPEQYMRWDSIYSIIPSVTAIIGILLTIFVIRTLLKHIETPIVKASGRELSFILLAGIMICFLMTFVLLAKPSIITCSLQRFGVGTGFSVMYGALLIKTNRISRIFDSARSTAKRPSFISPKSQVWLTFAVVFIQILGTGLWFIMEPPATRHWFPDMNRKSEVVLKCKVNDASFLMSLIYNIALITTCTIYAIKTRKIPENFNESKFIGFTMYTTCIIWLAFIPLYFGTVNNYEIQITTLCVSISLSAYVALFCLFSPKIYIIIFHPDKNVRKLTMNSATYKRALTSSTLATAATNQGSVEAVKLMVTNTGIGAPRHDSIEATSDAKNETSNLLRPPSSLPLKNTNAPMDPSNNPAISTGNNGKYSSTAITSAPPVSASTGSSRMEVTIFHEKPKDEIELAKSRKRSSVNTTTPTPSPAASDHHGSRSSVVATSHMSSKSSDRPTSPFRPQHRHQLSDAGSNSNNFTSSESSTVKPNQRRVTICDREIDLEEQQESEDPESILEIKKITAKGQSSSKSKGGSKKGSKKSQKHGEKDMITQKGIMSQRSSDIESNRTASDSNVTQDDGDDTASATSAMTGLSLASRSYQSDAEQQQEQPEDTDMDYSFL